MSRRPRTPHGLIETGNPACCDLSRCELLGCTDCGCCLAFLLCLLLYVLVGLLVFGSRAGQFLTQPPTDMTTLADRDAKKITIYILATLISNIKQHWELLSLLVSLSAGLATVFTLLIQVTGRLFTWFILVVTISASVALSILSIVKYTKTDSSDQNGGNVMDQILQDGLSVDLLLEEYPVIYLVVGIVSGFIFLVAITLLIIFGENLKLGMLLLSELVWILNRVYTTKVLSIVNAVLVLALTVYGVLVICCTLVFILGDDNASTREKRDIKLAADVMQYGAVAWAILPTTAVLTVWLATHATAVTHAALAVSLADWYWGDRRERGRRCSFICGPSRKIPKILRHHVGSTHCGSALTALCGPCRSAVGCLDYTCGSSCGAGRRDRRWCGCVCGWYDRQLHAFAPRTYTVVGYYGLGFCSSVQRISHVRQELHQRMLLLKKRATTVVRVLLVYTCTALIGLAVGVVSHLVLRGDIPLGLEVPGPAAMRDEAVLIAVVVVAGAILSWTILDHYYACSEALMTCVMLDAQQLLLMSEYERGFQHRRHHRLFMSVARGVAEEIFPKGGRMKKPRGDDRPIASQPPDETGDNSDKSRKFFKRKKRRSEEQTLEPDFRGDSRCGRNEISIPITINNPPQTPYEAQLIPNSQLPAPGGEIQPSNDPVQPSEQGSVDREIPSSGRRLRRSNVGQRLLSRRRSNKYPQRRESTEGCRSPHSYVRRKSLEQVIMDLPRLIRETTAQQLSAIPEQKLEQEEHPRDVMNAHFNPLRDPSIQNEPFQREQIVQNSNSDDQVQISRAQLQRNNDLYPFIPDETPIHEYRMPQKENTRSFYQPYSRTEGPPMSHSPPGTNASNSRPGSANQRNPAWQLKFASQHYVIDADFQPLTRLPSPEQLKQSATQIYIQ